MTAAMRLTAEDCAATFDPDDGGRLTSFRVGDHELLVPHGKDIFHFGSFVVAPWVGRLRDASLNYQRRAASVRRQQRAARLARAGHGSAMAGHSATVN